MTLKHMMDLTTKLAVVTLVKHHEPRPCSGLPVIFYMYLVYGMYWMLNIVTGQEGYPAAILIRGAGDIYWDQLCRAGMVTKTISFYFKK
ncbi:MAG: DNA-3-methyladenine glycosylase [bacterium]